MMKNEYSNSLPDWSLNPKQSISSSFSLHSDAELEEARGVWDYVPVYRVDLTSKPAQKGTNYLSCD